MRSTDLLRLAVIAINCGVGYSYAVSSHSDTKDHRILYSMGGVPTLPRIAGRDVVWDLQVSYQGQTFFDGWEFFHESDPSHGLVNYVPSSTAFAEGLAFWTASGVPGIQADHWSHLPVNTPRNSIRLSSKALFAGGLFVIDVALMPWGCGVWPAFWLLGYEHEWPYSGEIDIFEGVQAMSSNQMTVTPGLFEGTVVNDQCDSTTGGSGCSILSKSDTSYGMKFNEAGGGVFACLWDGAGVKIWSWNRATTPKDLTGGDPKPTSWGAPDAAWDASTCDPYKYFGPQEMILNINLCGDWAGGNYAQYPYCPGTCASYIADPTNLNNSVMLINSIKVYQELGVVSIVRQVQDTSNQTGAGGPVGRIRSHGDRRRIPSVPLATCFVVVLCSAISFSLH